MYKISASRTKYQIYLNISEAQPNFCECEASTKISGTERKNKFQRANVMEKFTFLLLNAGAG